MILRISCVVLALSLAIGMWQNEKLRRQLNANTELLQRSAATMNALLETCK